MASKKEMDGFKKKASKMEGRLYRQKRTTL